MSQTNATPQNVQLPVLFAPDVVVLPGMVVPIELDNERRAAIDAARLAVSTGRAPGVTSESPPPRVLVVPRLDGHYGSVGAIAEITQVGRLPSGEPAAAVRAVQRARIGAGVNGPGAALWVDAEPLPTPEPDEATRELASQYKSVLVSVLQERGNWQVIDVVQKITDPSELADAAGYASWIDEDKKVELLETPDTTERLNRVLEWSRSYLAEIQVSEKIREDVQDKMEKGQREYVLRQQLAAIRKELNDITGESGDQPDDYRTKVEQANLPEQVHEAAMREVDKLERTSDQAPDAGWIRTWLDTILELPWNERTADSTDLSAAQQVLDADHSGLEEPKQRIVEYLAVRNRRNARGLGPVGGRARHGGGAVLALVGPPGVGKTSLGESVARALGRKFVRVALGGVRDEAEIRGHRRTYVGALPGRIVRAISEAGSMNPVVLLDEVDKVGADFRGDPTGALLEVLDPAQNHTFRDHYLEVDLDLSDVLFLATANVLDTIPPALLDRMEVVTLDGYTEQEKVSIAREHLLPRQLDRAALSAEEVEISDGALQTIAADYTREAGVRGLERNLAKILRKVATSLALTEQRPAAADQAGLDQAGSDQTVSEVTPELKPDQLTSEGSDREAPLPDEAVGVQAAVPVRVDVLDLGEYLGRPRFQPEHAQDGTAPGVATGLAVTGAGGDALQIETALYDGGGSSAGSFTITGQLGEVMQESARIASSYLRANGAGLGIDPAPLSSKQLHVHVPAGAVPKDGPSAGITMTTALASLLSGRPVRREVAMTGEVSLTGRVLPIGGVKQKLLAALRAGVTEVVLPEKNKPDLDDVPEQVLAELTVHTVSDVREVLDIALTPASERRDQNRTVAA